MLYTKELADSLREAISGIELKAEEEEGNTFDVIATTQDMDRDGEIIKINGWDTTNYFKNPVVLANHRYVVENIVGKWLEFYTSKWVKRLKGVFSKTNPLGVLLNNLYNEWMLKAVSVGFIPLLRNANDRSIIEKAELLEVSFVAVPCNPNAISLDRKVFDEAVAKWLLIEEKEIDNDNDNEEEKKDITLNDIKELVEKNISIKTEIDWMFENLNTRLDNIEKMIKGLADDKAEAKKVEDVIDDQKTLQDIDKAIGVALSKIKQLKTTK